MICQGPPVMFDRFFGSQAPSGVRPARAKHSCYVPSMTPITSRASRPHSTKNGILVLWQWLRPPTKPRRQASLYSKISSGPGRLTEHIMEHNMSPRHSTVWARRMLDNKQIGQHTDESVHYMSGESRVLPLLRSATAVVQSDAFSRVSDPNGP